MIIIVNKGNTKPMGKNSSQHQSFTPHWNRMMDKKPVWCGTRGEYDRQLKSRGLTKYDPDHQPKPPRKDYVASKEGRELVQAIQSQSKNGKFTPSGVLKDALVKKGALTTKEGMDKLRLKVESMVSNPKQGGF